DGIEEVSQHKNPKHAYNEIGVQYTTIGQYDKALAWFRQASDRNSSSANYNIGRAYELGLGVGKDVYTALDWYIKASIQKYADAFVAIGNVFYNGIGVPVDIYVAFEWFYKSERGDLINNMKMRHFGLDNIDTQKSLAQLVNETESIYRTQRDAPRVALINNINNLDKEIHSNRMKLKEKDDQIERLKRDIQNLDPNAFVECKDGHKDLTTEYKQSKRTVESLESKLFAAEEREMLLKRELEDLYIGSLQDGLCIDDQSQLLKDSIEALKQQLKDPDNIIDSLQIKKKKLQRAMKREMKDKDSVENKLREELQSKNKELETEKINSKLNLNIAKLRNDTLASVNRKLKNKFETSQYHSGIKREYSQVDKSPVGCKMNESNNS
ncbi:hypothetical protein K501DRAFT_277831, partial [Backusella circina FSU 941]